MTELQEAEVDYGDDTRANISPGALHKRKHSRVDSGVSGSLLSDTSGHRVYSADYNTTDYSHDEDASSAHSSKRRRSNDWPLPDGASSPPHSGSKHDRSSRRRRGPSATPRRGGSRFIEASMHDRVSEVPPGVYIGEMGEIVADHGEETEHARLKKKNTKHQRGNNSISGSTITNNSTGSKQSSIVRFGKNLASYFNPVMWVSGGGGSEDGKGAAMTATPAPLERDDKEALKIAGEKAYAELKKTGFKGTAKGDSDFSGSEARGFHPNPKATNENISNDVYKTPKGRAGHKSTTSLREGLSAFSRTNLKDAAKTPAKTPAKVEPLTSIKTSFSDLRKAKSNYNLPSTKYESMSPAPQRVQGIEGNDNEHEPRHVMRKEPSRKDLKRTKKLTKQVSDLEEQLEKARRELRVLTGDENPPVPPHRHPPPSHENRRRNKFTPGSLPTLPSERILQRRETSEVPETDASASFTAAAKSLRKASAVESADEGDWDGPAKKENKTPKPARVSSELKPNTVKEVTSSRKRKPAPLESEPEINPNPIPSAESEDDDYVGSKGGEEPSRRMQPPRQAKLQKTEKLDSPGSAERKQQRLRSRESMKTIRAPSRVPHPVEEKRNPRVLKRHRSSPNNNRQSTSKFNLNPTPSPMLKAKKSTIDLRSGITNDASEPSIDSTTPKATKRNDENSNRTQDSVQRPSQAVASSGEEDTPISPAQKRGRKRTARDNPDDDGIPPVPPVPKGLRNTGVANDNSNGGVNRFGLRTAPAVDPPRGMGFHHGSTPIATVPEDVPMQTTQNQKLPTLRRGKKLGSRRNAAEDFEWPDEIF